MLTSRVLKCVKCSAYGAVPEFNLCRVCLATSIFGGVWGEHIRHKETGKLVDLECATCRDLARKRGEKGKHEPSQNGNRGRVEVNSASVASLAFSTCLVPGAAGMDAAMASGENCRPREETAEPGGQSQTMLPAKPVELPCSRLPQPKTYRRFFRKAKR